MIVILGAGLAGLSTAYYLRCAGRLDYAVFERDERPCGLVRSHTKDGFTFDRTGHFLHLRDSEVRQLATHWLGDKLMTVSRDSRIYSHGVFTRYPFQTNTFGLPVEVVKECLLGYIQAMHGSVEIPRGQPVDDPGVPEPKHSFESWIYSNFGAGIAKHFMIPYNDRLWGMHPRYLTTEWMGRFVPRASLDSVIQGALGDRADSSGYNGTFQYPQAGGIESFGLQFASRVGPIQTCHEAMRIDTRKRRVYFNDIDPVEFRVLVSSIPLPTLCKLLHPLPKRVADAAAKLRWSSVFAINWGVVGDGTSGHHWVYVPERKFAFYRTGCYSNASSSMAPPGHSSIWIEVSYNSRRPIDRKTIRQRAIDGLIEMGILSNGREIVAELPIDIPYAYVIHDIHHQKATRTIHQYLRSQNIFSIGRYGQWEYSSMEDAILHGRGTAQFILQPELNHHLPA